MISSGNHHCARDRRPFHAPVGLVKIAIARAGGDNDGSVASASDGVVEGASMTSMTTSWGEGEPQDGVEAEGRYGPAPDGSTRPWTGAAKTAVRRGARRRFLHFAEPRRARVHEFHVLVS